MPDPTKLPHQDNPENPNEDLSDERQRKKANREAPSNVPGQPGTPGKKAGQDHFTEDT